MSKHTDVIILQCTWLYTARWLAPERWNSLLKSKGTHTVIAAGKTALPFKIGEGDRGPGKKKIRFRRWCQVDVFHEWLVLHGANYDARTRISVVAFWYQTSRALFEPYRLKYSDENTRTFKPHVGLLITFDLETRPYYTSLDTLTVRL